jgi:hypothetical protein
MSRFLYKKSSSQIQQAYKLQAPQLVKSFVKTCTLLRHHHVLLCARVANMQRTFGANPRTAIPF